MVTRMAAGHGLKKMREQGGVNATAREAATLVPPAQKQRPDRRGPSHTPAMSNHIWKSSECAGGVWLLEWLLVMA